MQITSTAFANNHRMPQRHTCHGENINPPLSISGAAEGTKSLVLIMHDPDAVSGDFTHWLVWGIDPGTTELLEDSAPTGSQEGMTGFGRVGYGGPCPPQGTGIHHYIFELYAIDTTLDLPSTTTESELRGVMKGRILATSKLTGIVNTA